MKEVWGFGAGGFDLMGSRKMVVRAISRHGGFRGRSGKRMCGGWAVGSGMNKKSTSLSLSSSGRIPKGAISSQNI
ncbi:unnamed protein product [Prunus armeniaca]|uniref:Uncharacterized protein n=1 Tax=Prunus armeniaca TaxID=36596 RepID=A0A6J5UEU5_PRUAR|nr:unnamed protein product [Prunus armeniaca]